VVREQSAVLGNSRSEPGQVPQTPRKPISNPHAPLTPQSRGHPLNEEKAIGLTDTPTGKNDISTLADEDSVEWPSSDKDEFAEEAAQATMPPPVETPRKTLRTEQFTSPGKRRYNEIQSSGMSTWPVSTPSNDDDVFMTPTTSNRPDGLLSPTATPAQIPPQLENQSQPVGDYTSNSTLATEVLKILTPIPLNSSVQSQLVELLNRHDLRTQGIAKGRDITRLAIQSRERKIAELQARIAGLEAERQTSRTVIAHLKQDIGVSATSPKKGQGRFTPRNGTPGDS
jgi:hypothetical protein